MTARRNDESVVDLFDSIELDCSKWTEEERKDFRVEVGLTAAQAVGAMVATLLSAPGIAGTGSDGTNVSLDATAVRGLRWISRRRRQPGLAFADVEVKDLAAISSAIEKQTDALLANVTHNCGPETLALCLSVMPASASGRPRWTSWRLSSIGPAVRPRAANHLRAAEADDRLVERRPRCTAAVTHPQADLRSACLARLASAGPARSLQRRGAQPKPGPSWSCMFPASV